MISAQRYRYLWINPETGRVNLQLYDLQGQPVDQFGQPGRAVELELERIPFVMLDIAGSLIKDVCQQQIAVLNLGSGDVSYALRSNFPFYVEQKDLGAVGAHLKHAATADGTSTTGGQGAADTDIKVGATHARAYDKGMNPPAFINPSAEPLRASLELQDRLKRDVRELVNLAVSALAVRASAESKAMEFRGIPGTPYLFRRNVAFPWELTTWREAVQVVPQRLEQLVVAGALVARQSTRLMRWVNRGGRRG